MNVARLNARGGQETFVLNPATASGQPSASIQIRPNDVIRLTATRHHPNALVHSGSIDSGGVNEFLGTVPSTVEDDSRDHRLPPGVLPLTTRPVSTGTQLEHSELAITDREGSRHSRRESRDGRAHRCTARSRRVDAALHAAGHRPARADRARRVETGPENPLENELNRMYGISRLTARQVLAQLVSEDLLFRVQGKGTFVAIPKIATRALAYMGIREQLERMEISTTTRCYPPRC